MRKLQLRSVVLLFAAAATVASVLYVMPLFAAVPNTIPSIFFSVSDSGGANNGPGQKDLTLMGWYEDPGANAGDTTDDVLDMVWNWDEITVNGNNTLDACALFDSDDDTFINVAICGTVQKVNGPNGGMLIKGAPTVYTCSDAKEDRCTNPALQPAPTASQATGGGLAVDGSGNLLPIPTSPTYDLVTNTDPFTTGDASPQDTTIRVRVARSYLNGLVGTGTPLLTNVCSYPSQQPNSDPSDCNNPPGGGFLKIVKDAVPDATTEFDFKVKSFPFPAVSVPYPCPTATPCDAKAKEGTPAQMAVLVGTVDIEELAETDWSLGGVTCAFEGNGTANGSLDGTTYKNAQIKSGLITVCTFTNNRNSGTIRVRKVLDPVTSDTFTLAISGGVGSASGKGNNGLFEKLNVPTGTYTLSETADSPASLAAYDTTWSCTVIATGGTTTPSGTTATTDSLTLTNGGSIDCTFTNSLKQGTLIVKKIVNNAQNPSATPKVAKDFSFQVNAGTAVAFPDNNADADNNTLTATAASITVAPGTNVNVVEVAVTGYSPSYDGCSGIVAGGTTVTCTITNTFDKTSPGKTTQQNWIIKDTITFTGNPPKISEGDAVGTAKVSFRLYSNSACSTLVGANLNMDINAASGVAVTATGVAVSNPGTYYWRVEYTGNAFYNSFNTGCTTAGEQESTQIIALDNVNTP